MINTLPCLLLVFFFCLTNCVHTNKNLKLNQKQKIELYELLKKELKQAKAHELQECNCMKAFYRNIFQNRDDSVRYTYDDLVGEHSVLVSKDKRSINVLAIGSGTLLNELTAIANILARGINLNLYIIDYAYIFYGDKNFKEKATNYGKHPQLIPEGWKDFYFWSLYKDKKESYLSFFEKYHTAINKFKILISNLDNHYGTKTKVTVLKPPSNKPIHLAKLDLVISIDAFIDVPNLMWNLFYQMQLSNKSIRFLALNKAKHLGGFWDSPDLSIRESNSLHPVSIDIYDISSTKNFFSYKLVDKLVFYPTKYQLEKAPEFKKDPERSATQSPFDL